MSAYGVYWYWARFGPGYRGSVKEYRRREAFEGRQWREWQEKRLQTFLPATAEYVPFYRQTWTESEKRAARTGSLQDLPLLEKEPLRADPYAFLRRDRKPWPRLVFHTSGSTGTPIATMWTVHELRDSRALREARSAWWARVSFHMPRATISGRLIEPDSLSRGPYYRYNAVERQVYLSAFHLRRDTAASYVEALRRHKIQWLTGYGMSYYFLAEFILEEGLTVPPLRAVITTSEKVTSEMRLVMEKAYKCKVFEEYSTVENALFANECEEGKLHVSPDVAVVEIIRPDGSACEPNEVGEVVTTCLMREYQPLVRYRVGDLAMWDAEPCSCGRSMPVLKEVVGRLEDVVVGPDGRKVVRFHGIFLDQPHIREGQIVQEAIDRIRVKVVTTAGYGSDDEADIVHRVQNRLGPRVKVIVEPVAYIPRTPAGKFRSVLCQLGSRSPPTPHQ